MSAKKLASVVLAALVLLAGLTAATGVGAAAGGDCDDERQNKVYSNGEDEVYQDPDTGETCEEDDDPDSMHDIRTQTYQTVLGDDRLGSCLADATSPGSPEEELARDRLPIPDRLSWADTFVSIATECGPF